MTVTATDLFCGAGGSSLGAEAAGARLVMAANHWQTAIEVHQRHFPEADHDLADISQADPRRYPRTNLLLASPECTNHSQARGVRRGAQSASLFDEPDPSAERSRATMWDVVRFAEQLRYDALVVENVVEATQWVLWSAWRQAIRDLGYESRVISHNSMHHAVPQSRDRIYVVCWRPGLAPDLELELRAPCPKCERRRPCRQAWRNDRTAGRYGQAYHYACTRCGTRVEPDTEPAARIIDWALPCPEIGSRSRPLAAATRARILAGLQRYGYAPEPGTEAPATGSPGSDSFLFQTAHGGRMQPTERPHPTVNASDDRQALVIPLRKHGHALPVSAPLPGVTAGGNHHGLLMRNAKNPSGNDASMVTPLHEPARTMTTSGHQSLLMPYYGNGRARPASRPAPTMRSRDTAALIDPAEVVDRCGFRMLEPHEVAAAMAFPAGYIPDSYTKKDRVRLAGNAVTPPVMSWIVGRLTRALEEA